MNVRYALPIVVALAATPGAAAMSPRVGTARVIDGDTIAIGSERVRIWGIDAPEMRQFCLDGGRRRWPCGLLARRALADRIDGRLVRCVPRERDAHKRMIAACSLSGEDIGAWLVREGWALDYRLYSHGAFAGPERMARESQRNIWAGHITPPWVWRASQRRAVLSGSSLPPSPGCALKGNVSKTGQRIVHTPRQRDYDAVKIDTGRGERWFCSLAAARTAGWRPAAR